MILTAEGVREKRRIFSLFAGLSAPSFFVCLSPLFSSFSLRILSSEVHLPLSVHLLFHLFVQSSFLHSSLTLVSSPLSAILFCFSFFLSLIFPHVPLLLVLFLSPLPPSQDIFLFLVLLYFPLLPFLIFLPSFSISIYAIFFPLLSVLLLRSPLSLSFLRRQR